MTEMERVANLLNSTFSKTDKSLKATSIDPEHISISDGKTSITYLVGHDKVYVHLNKIEEIIN